jgi:hypothetical protein
MKKAKSGFFHLILGSLLFPAAFLSATLHAQTADQVFTCPKSILVMNVFTGQAPEGWKGAGEAGPYMFKRAEIINQNQLACRYTQQYVMANLYRTWEAGNTCTFDTNKKTWTCKDAAGSSKSYPCLASMMISATAQNQPPEGWKGGGESGPFPFLNAPEPDNENRLLRCSYRIPEFTYFLTRQKPTGLCSFDTVKMAWVCVSPSPARNIPVRPDLGNKQVPIH